MKDHLGDIQEEILKDLQEAMYVLLCKEIKEFGATVDEFDLDNKRISVDSPACKTKEVSDAVSKVIRLYFSKKKEVLGLGAFGGVSDIVDLYN